MKNPWKRGTLYHRLFTIYTKKKAPTDAEILEEVNRTFGTTRGSLYHFKSRLRNGTAHKTLDAIPELAKQDRSPIDE